MWSEKRGCAPFLGRCGLERQDLPLKGYQHYDQLCEGLQWKSTGGALKAIENQHVNTEKGACGLEDAPKSEQLCNLGTLLTGSL